MPEAAVTATERLRPRTGTGKVLEKNINNDILVSVLFLFSMLTDSHITRQP